MFSFFVLYKNSILQAGVCLISIRLSSYLDIPARFLQGIFSYIHPENLGSSEGNSETKKRKKSNQKLEFDESNAQIFRIKLDESHLRTRAYFQDYHEIFTYLLVLISCYSVHWGFHRSDSSDIFLSGAIVPITSGILCLLKVLISLAKVTFEKSASTRWEKQLSVLFGVLGFISGMMMSMRNASPVFSFEFHEVGWVGVLLISALMGCISCFLYIPSVRFSRSFWIGTDRPRWNLFMISCGWVARLILYSAFLSRFITSSLWVNPLIQLNVDVDGGSSMVGNVRMLESDFAYLRTWSLVVSGVLQILSLRPNLQMYLNEGLLCWYQRLHASRVPDLDYSRAKIFLVNHYSCLTALQFLSPAVLCILFVVLSQVDEKMAGSSSFLQGVIPYSSFIKDLALFLGWWVNFVVLCFTSVVLVSYRHRILYI